jgi:hypothetical protein
MKKTQVNMVQKVGSWAFIAGLIIAIIAGMYEIGPVLTSILIILGLIVGFLNVTGKETNTFLFTTLVLVVMAGFGGQVLSGVTYVGPFLQSMFSAMMLFLIPAALIVALKAIYALAENE